MMSTIFPNNNNRVRTHEELKKSCLDFNNGGFFFKQRHLNNYYIGVISKIKKKRPFIFIENRMVPCNIRNGVKGNPKNLIFIKKLETIYENYEYF